MSFQPPSPFAPAGSPDLPLPLALSLAHMADLLGLARARQGAGLARSAALDPFHLDLPPVDGGTSWREVTGWEVVQRADGCGLLFEMFGYRSAGRTVMASRMPE